MIKIASQKCTSKVFLEVDEIYMPQKKRTTLEADVWRIFVSLAISERSLLNKCGGGNEFKKSTKQMGYFFKIGMWRTLKGSKKKMYVSQTISNMYLLGTFKFFYYFHCLSKVKPEMESSRDLTGE